MNSRASEAKSEMDKCGALSDDSSRIELSSSMEPGEGGGKSFMISWDERGGPVVKAPARVGFGTTVLFQVSKENLDAQVELNYASAGPHWRLQCPAGEVMENGLSV